MSRLLFSPLSRLLGRIFLLIGCIPALLAAAEPPPLLAVEDFFKNSAYDGPALSPNGRFLAAMVPTGDRRNIAVVDLESRSVTVVTAEKEEDVATFFWANNDTIVFQRFDRGYIEFAMFAVQRDGSRLRNIVPPVRGIRFSRLLSVLHSEEHHILITNNERRYEHPDVFRLDIRTGRKSVVVRNPGNVLSWGTDHQGVVRLGFKSENEGRRNSIIWRPTARAEWEELATFGMRFMSRDWGALGFDEDNQTLLIACNEDADTAGVYTYDPATRTRGELILRDNRYDAGGSLRIRQSDHKILGMVYMAEKATMVWFDDEMNRWQREVDRLHPDTLNFATSSDHQVRRVIWTHFSDRQPAKFSLLDLGTRKIEPLFESRPWINPDHMAPMRPISFTARDGRRIPGYLTLPVGHDGERIPLIIHPHGGPWAREVWEYSPEVQYLANRGFAVLQVDFRGSTGYGFDHLNAARREFGKAMQDDLSDAVKWAIAEGFADPDQVGIYGASYGGYATMAGLVFTPELYAFGINYVGVVDVGDNINWWKEIGSDSGFNVWSEFFGHPTRDRESLAAISPVHFIDRVRVPLLVIHGEWDRQVPIRQYRKLASALRSAGKPFESVVRHDEGHGFRKQENKFNLYKKFDEFLTPFSIRLRNERVQAPAVQ